VTASGQSTMALISAAKGQDRDAAERLFRSIYPRVLRIVEVRLGRRLRRHFEPDDIAQSVFGRAYRKIPRFEDRGPGSFVAWLDEIIECTIRDKARWLAAAKRSDGSSGGSRVAKSRAAPSSTDPVQVAQKGEQLAELRQAMQGLTERERKVIELRLFVGLRGTEVSDAMGITHELARKLYSRALKKVKAGMQPPRNSVP
jgi:RNA polymerase sigma-70 factor (ECF subfamily)